jgi:hypothetical protein
MNCRKSIAPPPKPDIAEAMPLPKMKRKSSG